MNSLVSQRLADHPRRPGRSAYDVRHRIEFSTGHKVRSPGLRRVHRLVGPGSSSRHVYEIVAHPPRARPACVDDSASRPLKRSRPCGASRSGTISRPRSPPAWLSACVDASASRPSQSSRPCGAWRSGTTSRPRSPPAWLSACVDDSGSRPSQSSRPCGASRSGTTSRPRSPPAWPSACVDTSSSRDLRGLRLREPRDALC